MWGKLCGFIHYNVKKYVVFIVAYITLKWQFDIRDGTYYTNGWNHKVYLMQVSMSHSFLCEKNHILL
jgi:hypothetical protein